MDEQEKPQSAGGKARAGRLTAQERSEIAKKGAAARWGETVLAAAFGSAERPLVIGGIEIPCYVLEDGTRVLARAGFIRAIGRKGKAKGGRQYDEGFGTPVFLTADNLKPFIPEEISGNSNPIVFKENGKKVIGYRAEFLPQVCEIFMDALDAGALRANQVHIAQACKALHRSFAKTGIIALIDEATGYQDVRPRDALRAYLDMVLRKELAAWAKRFPDEFYENIYRLKGWPWPGMQKNRYSVVAHYTRDLVYERIAPTLIDELEAKNPKDEKGNRKTKFHQWLTEDVGHPLLAQHIHSLVMFQRLAIANGYGWNRFVKMVDVVLPKKGSTLELPLTEPS